MTHFIGKSKSITIPKFQEVKCTHPTYPKAEGNLIWVSTLGKGGRQLTGGFFHCKFWMFNTLMLQSQMSLWPRKGVIARCLHCHPFSWQGIFPGSKLGSALPHFAAVSLCFHLTSWPTLLLIDIFLNLYPFIHSVR